MASGYDDLWRPGDPRDDPDADSPRWGAPDERHRDLIRSLRSTAGIPEDARRMGLDRNTVEGAMVGFTGSLDSSRLSHRIVAWVLLLMVVLPIALNLLRQLTA